MKTLFERFFLTIAIILTVGFFAITASAGTTYYVSPSGSDSNSGDFDHPFKTISRGVDGTANSAHVPGDTLIVGGGAYRPIAANNYLPIYMLTAGAEGEPITIQGYSESASNQYSGPAIIKGSFVVDSNSWVQVPTNELASLGFPGGANIWKVENWMCTTNTTTTTNSGTITTNYVIKEILTWGFSIYSNPQQVFISTNELVDGIPLTQISWPASEFTTDPAHWWGFSWFTGPEFIDLTNLVMELRAHAAAPANYLWTNFTAEGRSVLSGDNDTNNVWTTTLVRELNALMYRGPFDSSAFAGVTLSDATQKLQDHPQLSGSGNEMVKYNRALIQDAFNYELHPGPLLSPPGYHPYYMGIDGLPWNLTNDYSFYHREIAHTNQAIADTNTIYIRLPANMTPVDKIVEVSVTGHLMFSPGIAHHVHLKNLKFRHSNVTSENLQNVAIGAPNDSVIENCDVRWMDSGGLGPGLRTLVTNTVIANIGRMGFNGGGQFVMDSCLVSNCNYRMINLGWECGGTKTGGSTIRNSEFTANWGPCIWNDFAGWATNADPMFIYHNYFHHNYRPYVDYYQADDWHDFARTNGSPVIAHRTMAIILLEASAKAHVYNNLFVSNATCSIDVHSEQCTVSNNIVMYTDGFEGINESAPAVTLAGWDDGRGNLITGEPIKFQNDKVHHNILFNDYGGLYIIRTNGGVDPAKWNTWDYNIYYNTLTNLWFSDNWATVSHFPDWQKRSGYDKHSVYGASPGLTGPFDLQFARTNSATLVSDILQKLQNQKVSISSPTEGTEFRVPGSIRIQADVSVFAATSVAFYQGTNLLGVASPPQYITETNAYSFTWTNVPPGLYTLTAQVIGDVGVLATSEPIHVSVIEPQWTPELTGFHFASNTFSFDVSGPGGSYLDVYASTNLEQWELVGGATLNGAGIGAFSEAGQNGVNHRFYRLSQGGICSKAVGFVRVPIPTGISLISNPLDLDGVNSAANILNLAPLDDNGITPPGTLNSIFIETYDGNAHNIAYYENDFTANNTGGIVTNGWSDDGGATQSTPPNLPPGLGFYINNNGVSSVENVFVGTVPEGALHNEIHAPGGLYGSVVPMAKTVDELGLHLSSGDFVVKYTNGAIASTYTYTNGSWVPSAPAIGIAEGVGIHVATNVDWVENFSACTGSMPVPAPTLSSFGLSSNIFTFNVSGPANTYWDVYASTDLEQWQLVGGVTLSAVGTAVFSEPGQDSVPRRFYRLSQNGICSKAVGFVRVTIPGGISYLSNPLDFDGVNNAADIFKLAPLADEYTGQPAGTLDAFSIQMPDSGGTYHVVAFYESDLTATNTGGIITNGWASDYSTSAPGTPPNLPPGVGFVINNQGNPDENVFVGTVPEGSLHNPIPAGVSMHGSVVPQVKSVDQLGLQFSTGDIVEKYSAGWRAYMYTNDSWSLYIFTNASWVPSAPPTLNIGESFAFNVNTAKDWIENFSACAGSIVPNTPTLSGYQFASNTFSFNVSGPADSYFDIYASTDLEQWQLIGGVSLDGAGLASFTEGRQAGVSRRFYRLNQNGVCSKAVGFVRVMIPSGNSFVCNPLDYDGVNNAADIFKLAPLADEYTGQPPGTIDSFMIEMPDNSGYHVLAYYESDFTANITGGIVTNGWASDNSASAPATPPNLPPGVGFDINNQGSAVENVFVGAVPEGLLHNPFPAGVSMHGSVVPQVKSLDQLGLQFSTGDIVTKEYGNGVSFAAYVYTNGSWSLSTNGGLIPIATPMMGVGESFTFNVASAKDWVENFTACSGTIGESAPALNSYHFASNTFSFDISGILGSYWDVYASTNLDQWQLIGSITMNNVGTASFVDNSQSGVAHRFYRLNRGGVCSKAVGFARVTIPSGSSFLSNPLDLDGVNNAANILNLAPLDDNGFTPPGTLNPILVETYNGSSYDVVYYENDFTENVVGPGFAGWAVDGGPTAPAIPPNLPPGLGFVIDNIGPSAENVFVGAVPQGSLHNLIPAGNSLRSSMIPQDKTVDQLGLQLSNGDTVSKWNGTGFDVFTFTNGSWSPSVPSINIGESAFIHASTATNWLQAFWPCQ